MALENIYPITVNTKKKMFREIPEVIANDNVVFEITIYDDAVLFPFLTGYTAKFVSLKLSGKSVIRDAAITDGVVRVVLGSSEMLEPGKVEGTVQIFDADLKRISTAKFDYVVKKDPSLQGGLPTDDKTLVIANEQVMLDAIDRSNLAMSRLDTQLTGVPQPDEVMDIRVRTDGSQAPSAGAYVRELASNLADKSNKDYATTTVFKSGVDFNSQYFRIPFMCTTKKGVIIAGSDIRYNGVNDFGRHDVGIARSLDGGKTWEDKQVVIHNNNTNVNFSRAMDSCIIYDESANKIYLFAVKLDDNATWYQKTDKTNWDLVFVTSTDDGKTWSAETSIKNIINPFADRVLFLTGVGSGIVMKNGTIVLPIQSSKVSQQPFSMQSGIVFSQDGGLTWNMSQTLLPELTSECNIVEYTDGSLLINARSDNSGKRCLYKTSDLGTTWIPTNSNYLGGTEKLMQLNGCMGSTIKTNLPNGKTKILYSAPHNLFSDYTNGRSNISLMTSIDNGETWEMVGSILPGFSDGYSCLSFFNNNLYVVLEVNGDIIFKDISRLINLAERDTKQKQATENGSYSFYVSSVGDDNNIGWDSTKPLKTIAKALALANMSKGNKITINIQNDITDNIVLKNLDGIESITFAGLGGVRNAGYLDVRNCRVNVIFSSLNFTGAIDSTTGNSIYKSTNVILLDCNFNNGSTRLLYSAYSNVVITNPSFTKVLGNTQDAIYLDTLSRAEIDNIKLATTDFRYGIYANKSSYNMSNTSVTDSSYVEGSNSVISNSTKPIKSNGYCEIKSNIVITPAYSNGWAANATYPLKHRVNGRITTMTGYIDKGTGALTSNTVIATLSKVLPRYKQIRVANGIVSTGIIPVLIVFNTDGTISLGSTVSDGTLTSIILDGITYENDV